MTRSKEQTVKEMARAIKEICVTIDYGECPAYCELFDDEKGCLLSGDDPSYWEIGEMP